MAHRGRVRRAFHKSGVKNQIWVSVLLDEVPIASAATLSALIVTAVDWSFVDGQRATIMTIRGWLSFCGSVGLAAQDEGTMFGLIAVQSDEAAIAPPADIADTYITSDILDTFGHLFPAVDVSVRRPSFHHPVNVKTKRTILSHDNIILSIKNNTGNIMDVSGVLRALVRKSD